jgi:outer membrane protein assembly factor BamB
MAAADSGEDRWPQFRGPGGLGIGSDKAALPSEFGPGKALVWKTELPQGHGSPCVWGDRIFVTGFDPAGKKIEVISVNRTDGKIVWRQTVPATEIEKFHAVSSAATSTPITDGTKVYVYIGSYGLLAYEWDGKPAWQYPMGVAKSPYGSGTSPVLAGDLVLVTRDYQPDPFLVAVRRTDGKLAWKADLAKSTEMGPQASHASPLLWHDQIVLHRPGGVSAHALKDGARLWWLATVSSGTSTPSAGDGVLFVNAFNMMGDPAGQVELKPYSYALEKYDGNKDGKLSESEAPPNDLHFLRRAGMPDNIPGAHFTIKQMFRFIDGNKDGFVDQAEYDGVRKWFSSAPPTPAAAGLLSIRPSGNGELPATALEWAEKRSVPEITAPLAYRGRVYMVTAGGIVTCVDAKTGKVIYRGRVNAPGAYYASPVAAGGKIFLASAEGVITVLGGGETLEILANNDIGEPVFGTPALVGPAIYVRSSQHLWAFGK